MTERQGYGGEWVSITRPSDTNAYSAGDVIGADTASTAAVEFKNMAPRHGRCIVVGTEIEVDVSAVPSGMTSFTLQCYSVTPPSAYGDNVAWDLPSGDRASYLGNINLGSPVDRGSTLYVRQNGLLIPMKLGDACSIFAYLTTDGGYTPSASAVKKVRLHSLAA